MSGRVDDRNLGTGTPSTRAPKEQALDPPAPVGPWRDEVLEILDDDGGRGGGHHHVERHADKDVLSIDSFTGGMSHGTAGF